MLLLTVLAGETELTAGYGGVHRSHDLLILIGVQHRLDAGDGGVQPLRDLAVGGLQLSRARGFTVQRGGEPGTINTQRMQLVGESFLVAISLTTPFDCRVEAV